MKRNTLPGAKFSQSVPNRKENTNGLKVLPPKQKVSVWWQFSATNSAKRLGRGEWSFGEKLTKRTNHNSQLVSLSGDSKTMFLTSQGYHEHRVWILASHLIFPEHQPCGKRTKQQRWQGGRKKVARLGPQPPASPS